jgi:hypothetical protein
MVKNSAFIFTNDKVIRSALKKNLENKYSKDLHAKVIEELGITHGAARVDIAVVNGVLHGYELKSDLDTLYRLPEQVKIYNSVLDQVTLVVGKNHLHEAIKIIPDWWGIVIAKIVDPGGVVSFCNIREATENPNRDSVSIAKLLWKFEALCILEKEGHAKGVRSKPRKEIYERLAMVLDQDTLRAEVREHLLSRVNWRSEKRCTLNDN